MLKRTKFKEPTKTVSFRVPESKAEVLKGMVEGFIKRWNEDNRKKVSKSKKNVFKI